MSKRYSMLRSKSVVVVVSLLLQVLDAFQPPSSQRSSFYPTPSCRLSYRHVLDYTSARQQLYPLLMPADSNELQSTQYNNTTSRLVQLNDLEWRIQIDPKTTTLNILEQKQWQFKALTQRVQAQKDMSAAVKNFDMSNCPPDGKAMLEVYHCTNPSQRIGKFGITTRPGPLTSELEDTVTNIYNSQDDSVDSKTDAVFAAAVIYMFIEPEWRSVNIGSLALQVISYLHAKLGCNYTILVADDNGSGKLVQWYERHGFVRAPLLQEMMGSPNAQYGTSMICKTDGNDLAGLRLQWW